MPQDEIYIKQPAETRWQTFENPEAAKGQAAKTNLGAKGRPYEILDPQETLTLLDVQGSGIVRRLWMTLDNLTPEALRYLRLDMYWDGSGQPAVSVPLGDFMGSPLGHMRAFENAFFVNPEGRSFVCTIPMPFAASARITMTSEAHETETEPAHRHRLFYDVNVTLTDTPPPDMLYFHAHWRRERPTELGKDFEILPEVRGSGRFLGAHIGVEGLPGNIGWWGEGEVKMYLDGDKDYPTLAGTGTEDYIGTAWGQGEFVARHQGAWLTDTHAERYTFYRYHVPDPVWFDENLRVTIQQMGGTERLEVKRMLDMGVGVKPVSIIGPDSRQYNLLDGTDPTNMFDPVYGNWWTNYYREDDVSAVALFYLDRPANDLPSLAPVEERTAPRYVPPLPEQPVVLSFGGASRDIRSIAAELLREYAFPSTVFISARNLDEQPAGLSLEDVTELHAMGHEIGAAPAPGAPLNDPEFLARGLDRVAKSLREALVPPPIAYAWPPKAPAPSAEVVEALAKGGIRFLLIATNGEAAPIAYKIREERSLFVPATAGSGSLDALIAAAKPAPEAEIPVLHVYSGEEAEAAPALESARLVELLNHLRDSGFHVMSLQELLRYRVPR